MGLLATYLDKNICTIHKITSGYTDQSGNWVPAVESDSSFNAHISDVSIKELQFIDPALVETGIRKLACESSIGLMPEDFITVNEKDGSTSDWLVHEKTYATRFLKKYTGEQRESFLLRRKI